MALASVDRSAALSHLVEHGLVEHGLAGHGLAGHGLAGVAARERALPVVPSLQPLLAQGVLPRGSLVGCRGVAGVSIALALAAGPAGEGAWVGVAGLPQLGVAAAVELGVPAERLVLVTEPDRTSGQRWGVQHWAEVLAAMIDGFDVVVVGPAVPTLGATLARRIATRLQARGAVLVLVDEPSYPPGSNPALPVDLVLQAHAVQWVGLGEGHGVARCRSLTVQASGRRLHRTRQAHLQLPANDGGAAEQPATVLALHPTG